MSVPSLEAPNPEICTRPEVGQGFAADSVAAEVRERQARRALVEALTQEPHPGRRDQVAAAANELRHAKAALDELRSVEFVVHLLEAAAELGLDRNVELFQPGEAG